MSVETVTIVTPPAGEPEGHVEKMIELVDGTTTPEKDLLEGGDPQSRPDWLPEGFDSPEDLAKAYAELKAQGGKAQETPQDKPTDDPAKALEENPQQALAAKGLSLDALTAEYRANGGLSEDSYKKLADAGYDRQIVDNYIAGQNALATQYEQSILQEVGGTEKYTEMVSWAKANLTTAEIDAYNRAVSSGDVAAARLAVSGLSARFSKAVGSEPKLIQGKAAPASDDVFESTAQVRQAMADPRYRNDPAYRAKVQAKLLRSNVF